MLSGVLEAGFVRVRCEGCRAEYLLALSCKTRYFCPSCHAKRLACWTQWLGEELLAPVPHRQMVFVLPKRLRPYFQWRRKLLGDLARIAARTAKDFVRATLDEPELSVGIALCIQTDGSLLNWRRTSTHWSPTAVSGPTAASCGCRRTRRTR